MLSLFTASLSFQLPSLSYQCQSQASTSVIRCSATVSATIPPVVSATIPPVEMADAAHPLIQRANEILYSESGFYSPCNEAAFSEDFVFRGPYIGPLNKQHLASRLPASYTRTGGIVATEAVETAAAAPPIPGPGDPDLLQRANEFVHMASGFYSPANEEFFDENFVFRGPVISPLSKADYLKTLGIFSIHEAYPDISPNAFGFTVDPADDRRVWFLVRNSGTNTGPLGLGYGLEFPPSGNTAEGATETFSITFDAAGTLVKSLTVGYVADRFQGNTGGSGAALGLMKVAGLVPMDFSAANPLFKFGQWLSNEVVDYPARTVSKLENVPAWWPYPQRGGEGS